MSEHIEKDYNFIKEVDSGQLENELIVFCAQINTEEDGDIALLRIETVDSALAIWFNQTLSENAEAQLNELVANYVFTPSTTPEEDQAQINILVGYLNNANPMIANAARAVIVLNIAPRLGPALIASINGQIATKIGG